MSELTKREAADLEKAYQIYEEVKQEKDALVDKIKQLRPVSPLSTYPEDIQRKIKLAGKCANYLEGKVAVYDRAFYEPPKPYSSPITVGGVTNGLPEKEAIKKKARDEERAKKLRERGGNTPVPEWDEGALRQEVARMDTKKFQRLQRLEKKKREKEDKELAVDKV